jgi:Putative adhesin
MHVFETPGSVSLHVRLPSGRVVVATADEPQTRVELVSLGRRGHDALEEIDVRAEERGGGHVVTIEQTPRFRWGPIQISWDDAVEARITCPHGSNIELTAGSTDVRVEGELGDVSVKTASGDVQLDRTRGPVEVKTASGDVSVGTIAVDSSLTTVSGDLRVHTVEGVLTARSVSGDVRLRVVRARLALATTSGDVELDRVEGGEVRIQSISGDATIGVGEGTRVFIDATSVSGSLGSELGLEPEPAASESPTPVVPLHVRTVSGDVSIVRAAVPAAAESV